MNSDFISEVNSMEKTFGEKLKSARKSAGLTQEQPAEKLVVSRQAITKWESEFYLVNQTDKQFLVVVTDEFIESRQLAVRITEKKFKIGEYSFIDCGSLSKN